MPPYTEDGEVEKLFRVIEGRRTHKATIVRDALLTSLALKTGLRRAELAALTPGDTHHDFLIVRGGKGGKDRVIPLLPDLALRLTAFTKGMAPNEKVFKLTGPSISNKIRLLSRKAGVDVHTHSLRHKFATDLLERGAGIAWPRRPGDYRSIPVSGGRQSETGH